MAIDRIPRATQTARRDHAFGRRGQMREQRKTRHGSWLAVMGFIAAVLPNVWLATPAQAATMAVTTAADTVNVDGQCSLREAMINANANNTSGSADCLAGSGPDTITFNIPGTGVQRIAVTTNLPAITETLTIDGYTQPGASRNTLAVGSDAVLRIELNGSLNPTNGDGLRTAFAAASGSRFSGLIINGFESGAGIFINGGQGIVVDGNWFGLTAAGTVLRNLRAILVQDGTGAAVANRIGGLVPGERNVISGSRSNGILYFSTPSAAPMQILGNYIGTTPAGGAGPVGNTDEGIFSFGGTSPVIGGTVAGAGNVISNNRYGIRSLIDARAPQILGNLIGTDATGLVAVPNTEFGIQIVPNPGIFSSALTTIGSGTPAGRNIISGNGQFGVVSDYLPISVKGNYIGVGIDGTTPVPNGGGVRISNPGNLVVPSTSQIGGTVAGEGNLIANNNFGVVITEQNVSGVFAKIVGNSIFNNTRIGIDLSLDPYATTNDVTYNHVGVAPGPNAYENFPVIDYASTGAGTLRLVGQLEVSAVTPKAIDVYHSPICHPSNFGEGRQYLGRFPVAPTAAGTVLFDQTISATVPATGFITATATDIGAAGGTSEFSFCQVVSTANVNWVNAQAITAGAVPGTGEVVTQRITAPLQEKWFKFPVQPGAKVRVEFTGVPGSAITLHRDPLPVYNGLINPTSAAALSAEAADFAFLPSGWLPSGTLPSGTLPSGTLPSGTLPSGTLPSGWLPSGTLPSGTLPSGTLPSGTLPSGTLPSGTLPSGTLPSGWLPSGTLPSGTLPSGTLDAYGTASRRSLLAVSMAPYSTTQTIERNTFDLQEDLYVRVVGPASLTNTFTVSASVSGGACAAVQPIATGLPTTTGVAPTNTSRATVIVTDSGRLAGTPAQKTAALADLQTLANRGDVAGVVVDLGNGTYPRVASANTQADANPGCPTAKNMVATEIKRVIDTYRSANGAGVQYVVIAGSADVIPFHQVQDVAGLANERDQVPPVAPNTPTEAGLKSGLVKGQDFYGSAAVLNLGGRTLNVPDLAVGRLVDNAADVSAAVANYIATNGVVTPQSSLVTGYDFVGDAAEVVRTELSAGTASSAETLIQPPGEAPNGPSAWTANQLRAKLFAGNHDVLMLTGHFSSGGLLAADYDTTVSASEVQASTTDLRNTIVLALGCHGGFALPSTDLLAGASPDPDWAKAFARKGSAGFVAATGYAYGDTELAEYGERLFINLTRQLRTGTGAVPLGQALVDAKRTYLTTTAQMTGIDEKTIVEMTLYGLPMMKVNMPGARLTVPVTPQLVTSTAPVPTGVGVGIGLTQTVATVNPAATTVTKTLPNLAGGGAVSTSYRTGRDGVIVNPYEPILPKQIDDVSVAGKVLRGVALRGGTYTDTTGITPLTGSPATETTSSHLSFNSDVFYPNQVYMPNYFDAVDGGRTRLITVPEQYRSTSTGSPDGTRRGYNRVDMALYYLPDSWTAPTASATAKSAAVSPAPSITGVSASSDGTTVTFNANVVAGGSAGVQAVWVVYTGTPGSPFHGTWAPVDLAPVANDPTTWRGTLALNGSNASALRFMVHAVNGAGLTSLSTNLGNYYTAAPPGPPPTQTPTTITLIGAPASVPYLTATSVTAELRSGSTLLAGRSVLFDIGGQQVGATTDANGRATATITPAVAPGTTTLSASYRGESTFLASTVSSPITISKVGTTLALSPPTTTVNLGQPTAIEATLRDSSGRPLGGKQIVFVVRNGTQSVARSVKADTWGVATLTNPGVNPGTYTVDAYFSGTVPLDAGQSIVLTDEVYDPSIASPVQLTISSVVVAAAPVVKADMGVTGLEEIGFQTNVVLITGSFTDADGVAPYTASVRWSAGGAFTPLVLNNNTAFVAANIYGSAGTRTVTVRICDASGQCGTDDLIVRTAVSQRVTPVLQCVTDRGSSTNPRYLARFGYNNPASFAIAIAPIPFLDNTFTTNPFLRGQPSIFLPGSALGVFETGFGSGTIGWRLNGTTVTARTNTVRC